MKKEYLNIIVLLFASVSLFAQAPYQKWLYQLGNTSQASGEKTVKVNSEEDIIVGGGFQNVLDFDYGPATLIKKGEYFVQKLSKTGELKWLKVWETFAFDQKREMVIDKNDNIYICGSYFGDVDFDPGPGVTNLEKWPVFVVKLDTDGNFIWAKGFGGGDNLNLGYANHILALAVDDNENVFLAGSFLGTTNFDTGSGQQLKTSNGESDIFVMKLDSEGDFEWVKTMGGYTYDYPIDMEVDHAGNVYTVGEFFKKMDADPSSAEYILQSYGGYDAFIWKLDTDGELVWTANMGANGHDSAEALYISDACDVYVAGVFWGVADFDPTSEIAYVYSPNGGGDVFVQKIDCDGNFQWAKAFGGQGYDRATEIFADDLGQVFVTGSVDGVADLDPGVDTFLTIDSEFNGFLSKLDRNGNFVWGTFSRGGKTAFTTVEGDNGAYIYMIGVFQDTVNLHPNLDSIAQLTSFGSSDVFFQKLQHCEHSFQEIFVKTCDSYTSPSGKYIIESDGVLQDTIQNITGCDSVLTIHVAFTKAEDLANIISLGPNPTSGTIHINSDFPLCDIKIRLYAMNGKQLFEETTNQSTNEVTLSLGYLPKGTYVLMIGKDEEFTTHRIIRK